MTREPWDDDRIASAYHDLADGSVPEDLASVVARATRPEPERAGWRGGRAVLAAAAVVVVLGGLVGIGTLRRTPEAGPATTPAGSVVAPTPQLPDGASPAPGGGFEPITVPQLLTLQAGKPDDRELAVRAFLSPMLALPCPMPLRQPTPLESSCPTSFVWLMAQPEILVKHDGNETSYGGPGGPAINPRLLETSGLPPFGGEDVPPADVVALGHFDDPRWTACPAEQQDACRRAFVVDRIVPPDGLPSMGFPEPWSTGQALREGTDVYGHLTELEHSLLTVLAAGSVDGAELARFEPSAGSVSELVAPGPVWVVRIMDPAGSGRPLTFVVREPWIDREPRVAWELTRDGPVRREAPGWTASPTASPTAP